jgi:hypothetical protein
MRRLLDSGTLYNHAQESLVTEYPEAVLQAAAEIGNVFPDVCPWNLETMLIDPVQEQV